MVDNRCLAARPDSAKRKYGRLRHRERLEIGGIIVPSDRSQKELFLSSHCGPRSHQRYAHMITADLPPINRCVQMTNHEFDDNLFAKPLGVTLLLAIVLSPESGGQVNTHGGMRRSRHQHSPFEGGVWSCTWSTTTADPSYETWVPRLPKAQPLKCHEGKTDDEGRTHAASTCRPRSCMRGAWIGYKGPDQESLEVMSASADDTFRISKSLLC